MAELENLKTEVGNLLRRIYKTKAYADKYDLVVDKKIIDDLAHNIIENLGTNVEFKECLDCYYCYHIAISESREIPIIPNYTKRGKQRTTWIKEYGKQHYQMYLTISKLGEYAMFYWTKYSYFLFERHQRKYSSPGVKWQLIVTAIAEILTKMNIKLLSPPLIFETFNIRFKGKIQGFDEKPSVIKLLFSEELH